MNDLPIVQVGSAGGCFKTGCAVHVDDGSATLTRGASEHFCTNTPINKYYCNLMNTLGVKAGKDGFPKLGGSGEVTRFGMSDRTEDFVGGGANPARIHSPGEYTALKA